MNDGAAWFLEQEAHALLARLDRIRPFVLIEPMLPAAAISSDAQRSIERYLIAGRRTFRRHIHEFVAWLRGAGRRAGAPEMQRRFTLIRLRFNEVLSDFDLFSDAISQRSEHETGVLLAGLDVAATDAIALPGGLLDPPPVVCYLDRGPGAAIRRARTRLPTGGENPVAIVRIPRERMVSSGIASSLVHESGHQSAELLELLTSLRPVLQRLQHDGNVSTRMPWFFWERWISEIVADFWSVAKVGVVSTLGLIGVVSLPSWFVFRLNLDDAHPAPWIRVLISCSIGDALYPDSQWKSLARLWESLYPVDQSAPRNRQLLIRLRDAIPELIALLVDHRPVSLGGKSLRDVMPLAERAPEILRTQWRSSKGSTTALRSVRPTLALAVAGQARMDGALGHRSESALIADLLEAWALRATFARADRSSSRVAQHANRPLESRRQVAERSQQAIAEGVLR